jgi:hypothetical protein
MPFWLAAAVVSTVVAGAATYAQNSKNASKQAAYNAKVEAANKKFRLEVMGYQNEQYQLDTDHFGKLIAYQKDEFEKNKSYVGEAQVGLEKDFQNQLQAQLQRIAETDIAAYLEMDNVNAQEQRAVGSIRTATADAGVAGNAVRLVEGEVSRQAGAGRVAVALQHKANRRQELLGMTNLKANRDTTLASLRMPTFQPLQAPAPPAPVSPVAPAAPVARPSLVGAIANTAASAISLAK